MYSKIGFLALFFVNNLRYFILYLALILILWLIVAHPRYRGPSKLITFSSSEQFYDDILGYQADDLIVGLASQEYLKKKMKENKKLKGANKPKEKSLDQMDSTLLVFTANWCDTCVYTHSLWVKFANRFSTKKIKVVEVDSTRFTNIC